MSDQKHRYHLRVHYKETDQMGVVHHANYVSWFEIGRTEKMRDAGIAYSDMEQLGLLLPVLDLDVKYHQPAYYDDCVAIDTQLTNFSPVRMNFTYEVRRVEESNCIESIDANEETTNDIGELLASGKTVHMWLNEDWRPTRLDRVAPDVYEQLQGLMGK